MPGQRLAHQLFLLQMQVAYRHQALKGSDDSAAIEVEGRLGSPAAIDRLRLTSGDVTVEGSVTLRPTTVLAVATGGSTLEELKKHAPDWAVSDLTQITAGEICSPAAGR